MQNESNSDYIIAQSTGHFSLEFWSECEHVYWDPKDGELCLNKVKPGETLVKACSSSDVQIDCQT